MKTSVFLILTLSLILGGCGFTSSTNTTSTQQNMGPLVYPFHISINTTVPENNVDSFVGDLWGTVIVQEDGSISGNGTIRYTVAGPCQWEPPAPQNQEPPYCQLTALTDGSFDVTGVVVEWIDGTDPLDASILASAQTWDQSTDRLPRELGLKFLPKEIPTETSDTWGWADLSIQTIQTNGLALGLDAAGVFDPFQVHPIILDGSESTDIASAGTYRFSGSSEIAQGEGTFFFVDKIPTSADKTQPEVLDESIQSGKNL